MVREWEVAKQKSTMAYKNRSIYTYATKYHARFIFVLIKVGTGLTPVIVSNRQETIKHILARTPDKDIRHILTRSVEKDGRKKTIERC